MVFIEKLKRITDNFTLNEPMRNHTTFRIGGNADIFISPKAIDEVKGIISLLKSEDYPYMVIGNGSNMLISDKGIRGAVICIGKDLSGCEIKDERAFANAGILMSQLSKTLLDASLSGFERLSGIPGTLGGAVFMNAGAYEMEISRLIENVTYLDDMGNVVTKEAQELCFGYRTSIFQIKPYVILGCTLRLSKGNKDEIREEISKYRALRNEKQPINMPSAGSTFKRPEGHFAGKLIQDAGLMGYTIGGAEVSKKHAGFIVNTGDATAKDVLDLIKYVQETVFEKFGVRLEPEVRLIGEK